MLVRCGELERGAAVRNLESCVVTPDFGDFLVCRGTASLWTCDPQTGGWSRRETTREGDVMVYLGLCPTDTFYFRILHARVGECFVVRSLVERVTL